MNIKWNQKGYEYEIETEGDMNMRYKQKAILL